MLQHKTLLQYQCLYPAFPSSLCLICARAEPPCLWAWQFRAPAPPGLLHQLQKQKNCLIPGSFLYKLSPASSARICLSVAGAIKKMVRNDLPMPGSVLLAQAVHKVPDI